MNCPAHCILMERCVYLPNQTGCHSDPSSGYQSRTRLGNEVGCRLTGPQGRLLSVLPHGCVTLAPMPVHMSLVPAVSLPCSLGWPVTLKSVGVTGTPMLHSCGSLCKGIKRGSTKSHAKPSGSLWRQCAICRGHVYVQSGPHIGLTERQKSEPHGRWNEMITLKGRCTFSLQRTRNSSGWLFFITRYSSNVKTIQTLQAPDKWLRPALRPQASVSPIYVP